jgi:hypothetical protein
MNVRYPKTMVVLALVTAFIGFKVLTATPDPPMSQANFDSLFNTWILEGSPCSLPGMKSMRTMAQEANQPMSTLLSISRTCK